MSRVVWVARLIVSADTAGQVHTIAMPRYSTLVHCREQRDDIALWFDVPNPAGSKSTRHFVFVGTGHAEIPYDANYIATCLFFGGDLILHVFEVYP